MLKERYTQPQQKKRPKWTDEVFSNSQEFLTNNTSPAIEILAKLKPDQYESEKATTSISWRTILYLIPKYRGEDEYRKIRRTIVRCRIGGACKILASELI